MSLNESLHFCAKDVSRFYIRKRLGRVLNIMGMDRILSLRYDERD